MADTLLRHLDMLSLIPPLPGKIASRDLHARLESLGYGVDVRSIERDLHKLSERFPLVSDEARPAGWSWRSGQSPLRFPRMDAGTALTYELVARYLAPAFPKTMLKRLEPDFAQARRVLDEFKGSPLARWSKHIAVLPTGFPLLAPEVKDDVSAIVYEALLNGTRFEASYRSVEAERPRRYAFNPLGLVYRDGVLYLVATLWEYEDPRHFPLQRISNPSPLDVPARVPKGFDFGRYVREERSFEYPAGDEIQLELRVDGWLARQLEERRLSLNQTIQPIPDRECLRVTATVPYTDHLFWWLRSLGSSVEVMKPGLLRRRLKDEAGKLADMYGF
ncbi:MAG: WYL domain-containing protein [Dokdonella sp.]|uniref:helix-turn-helix transcriptional regulator n=1 Tax=Dokdonella sp. TaxID=2291710 RepID=UPI0025BF05BA|nr:WYL domain-containing protein [Dokdonella sp.]MBZ0223886.1 WYL domain-containing protein [Dokdonella sp.]